MIKLDIILLLILIINVATITIYGYDKFASIRNMTRIPEKTLLILAFLFGAPGAFIAMKAFHHKTQKPVFAVFIPVAFVLELAIILSYMYKKGISF
ncbi:MAG: DUF1294 domain-containing protein [Ezakiella sp.]|nr:DUF1294 domain-containing protein [Ezakiella sp.]MDD7472419.1 DUF1294 domain-containing protein [Bacillota bacterium]MDY3923153.1 DUF1294 domain-containing protein [Ezakiella sp.]